VKKKYSTKIIAKDLEALKVISACCFEAKVKISGLKYLEKNKIFLISLNRSKIEDNKAKKKTYSVCKFDFIDKVKSKNIDQNNKDLVLELLSIDLLKNKGKFEINLIFSKLANIALETEIIEVTLEDQNNNVD
jgi:hypothetical protein